MYPLMETSKIAFLSFCQLKATLERPYVSPCLQDIDINNCRGCCSYNAANMSDVYKGQQARIKEINPPVEWVPCEAHTLNLVGVNSVALRQWNSSISFRHQMGRSLISHKVMYLYFANIQESLKKIADYSNQNLTTQDEGRSLKVLKAGFGEKQTEFNDGAGQTESYHLMPLKHDILRKLDFTSLIRDFAAKK